ncbi:hypothetical protein ACH427_04410 [Streptomyces sp. NPDC020379]|uniref:hypothetical protein n=1 Tax=Streptomyces sp. NPDC020379 TaxID=3365071 RepID=UPI0037B048A7
MELSADSVEAQMLDMLGLLSELSWKVNRFTGEVRYLVPADWEQRLVGVMLGEGGGPSGFREAA